VLYGTRRVGPDLIRESGRHSNDWHVVHFFRPRLTSPEFPAIRDELLAPP
jgi:cbb3-type cytochrome oxidase cytochrome c subunit